MWLWWGLSDGVNLTLATTSPTSLTSEQRSELDRARKSSISRVLILQPLQREVTGKRCTVYRELDVYVHETETNTNLTKLTFSRADY